jgi:lysophospholipase L1-like esterase
MTPLRRALIAGLVAGPLVACAGGGPTVQPPTPTPVPSPVGTERVSVVLYFDENGDGRMSSGEVERIPGAELVAGNVRTTSSVGDGRAVLGGLFAGHVDVGVRPETLPPYYVAPAATPIDVPHPQDLELGVTLPIGSNYPHLYTAFGDSITLGEGSSDDLGYLPQLQRDLQQYFGAAELVNAGEDGTKSWEGEARVGPVVRRGRPSWLLVHYGTNDWNNCEDVASCATEDSLRSIIRQAKANHTLPVLATVIPSNTGYVDAGGVSKAPPRRNEFVADQDVMIRRLAKEEHVALADLQAAILAEAHGDFSGLYVDHVHPNDRGYAIIAREFFKALTTPSSTASAALAGSAARPTILAPPRRPGLQFQD